MSDILIRMQDAEGRGPWKPGFSATWSDPEGPAIPRPITSAIPNFRSFVMEIHKRGYHIGCAVRAWDWKLWFTPQEEERLHQLGYRWHDASRCEVMWSGPEQVLIASKVHLRKLPLFQPMGAQEIPQIKAAE